jgi:cobyrinic acid a,c-diamide synthase
LALELDLPVILIVDCAHQAQSIAALIHGYRTFRHDLKVVGVFLNRVKSDRHAAILAEAAAQCGLPVIGQLRHTDSLALPSRHLGLVQAIENQALELTLESAALAVARETILDKLFELAAPVPNQVVSGGSALPPLGQNVCIARDQAFSFVYPHLLHSWRETGASLSFFSPLANESPPQGANAVFLPGGYPELFAGRLAANHNFLEGLRQFQGLIYGECGGYMVLGEAITDAKGASHTMAGLLPLQTSFAARKLHLGYRQLSPLVAPWKTHLRGHEFHYARIIKEGDGERVYGASTAAGTPLPDMGLARGSVMGSFAHVVSVSP